MVVTERQAGFSHTRALCPRGGWLCLVLLAPLLALPLQSQEPKPVAPPVRDQNSSGAPKRAQKVQPTEAAILASQGIQAFEKQNFQTAATRFGQAISQNPDDVASRFYLALSYSMLGKDSAALPHYQKLIEVQPEVYEIRLNYGQALINARKFADAAEQLARADQLKPRQTKTLYLLGFAHLAGGDAEQALKQFEAVLAEDPANLDALDGVARAEIQLGNLDAAEVAIRKAAATDPRFRESLLSLAERHEKEGNFEKAAALYGEFTDNPDAQKRAGELLVEHGKAEEAIASLEAAVKQSPTWPNRETLTVAYLRSGKVREAARELQEAVEAEPENVEAHLMFGRILRDARQFPAAASEFGTVIKLDPKNSNAWSEFAGAAVMAEQYQAAFDALAQLEKLGALKPGHHYLRAIILDKFQNDEQALSEYELFLAASNGQHEDEEFKARQRVRILKNKKKR